MMQLFTQTQLEQGVDLTSLAVTTTRGGSVDQVGEIRVKAGLPLHVSWTTFYTGDVTNRRAINKKKRTNRPILLTSAIKDSADGDAAQRGFLASWQESDDETELFPEATASGASVLYYSSEISKGLTITIDLFEKPVETKVLKQISAGLGQAAAFPPLGFASGFLLIGSTITKVADSIVDKLKSDKHSFKSSQQIYVDSAAPRLSEPRYTFFSPAQLDMEEAYRIQLSDSGKPHLVSKASGERYEGKNAYVICRYVQEGVPGLLDYDLQAKALELLKGWVPQEDIDPQALLSAITNGIRAVRES